jgi:3-oxoacyl-[acyl-carrier-protein] synthase-1/3-oxoacyl-[acyl-carrier-protein] synthase II
MSRAAAIAIGSISPLGRGLAAYDVTALDEPARVAIRRDPVLEALGFARPFSARVNDEDLAPALASDPTSADRATRLLQTAAQDLLAVLQEVRPGLKSERVGLVIGTSSGGMCSAQDTFTLLARDESPSAPLARASTYFAPFEALTALLASAGLGIEHELQIVTACAASTWALGVALRWLERGAVDVAIAGGYDAVGPFVAAGFEALRATSATLPAPFRIGRDGMALGEGAALIALVRGDDVRGAPVHFCLSGFGASTDAVHVTAPDRTGDGLRRAGAAALADAQIQAATCGLVSAHATATPYNDAMEARAIQGLFGASDPLVHAFKAQIGHTLGAAGVLETLAIAAAQARGVGPATAGDGDLDPDASVRLLARAAPFTSVAALKLSAAFGGANAALVIEPSPRSPPRVARARRRVYLKSAARVSAADPDRVAQATGVSIDQVARYDALSLLIATAVADLGDPARLDGAGIVVGHALATIDINERFYRRVLSRGPLAAEPRVFPPTSPNLMPGQVAIPFRLTGPSAAVCSGPAGALDPLRLAAELVAARDADRMVVAAVDLLGQAARQVHHLAFAGHPLHDGAVAALIDADPEGAVAEIPLDASTHMSDAWGHHALDAFLRGLRADPT